jgi:hypothetical protein
MAALQFGCAEYSQQSLAFFAGWVFGLDGRFDAEEDDLTNVLRHDGLVLFPMMVLIKRDIKIQMADVTG